MSPRSRLWLALGGVVAAAVLILAAAFMLLLPPRARPREARELAFVGSAKCAACHSAEYRAWTTSHHAVAMQVARPTTVLGRFDGAAVTSPGGTFTFFQRGDRFLVNTPGGDARPHDFDIAYTFGVWPLQQYLVPFAGGRLQTLPVAWDARPAATGGQRWFTVFPAAAVSPPNEAHWTGRLQNWNYRCADCHSTAVRKNYDPVADQFRTTQAELSIGCEACHGPGSRHVSWAKLPSWIRRLLWHDDGIPAQLTERQGVRWSIDSATGNATRSVPRRTDREIETCAQCHARRLHIADGYTAGSPLLDYYEPELIVAGLYYPDGQQRDEVYDYGSFLQSRMYHAGVTCADCHDPHTQQLRRPGNQLCTQCHSAAKYDTRSHHFHASQSAGAQCVACHMPDSAFMQIQPRRDHSLRIPRPDLSVSLGVPNACNRCHVDHDAGWAAAQVVAWYGRTPVGFQRFAAAFAGDDHNLAGAADSLSSVARDSSEPAIVRASALARLANHPGSVALRAAQLGSHDANALVELGALLALESATPKDRVGIAGPLLGNPSRVIRDEAAWLLAPASSSLPSEDRGAFQVAAAEFVESQRYNADRTVSRLGMGLFYSELGAWDSAAVQYRAARTLSPHTADAYVGLAGVLRMQGKPAEAERALEDGLTQLPGDPTLTRALDLLKGRTP